MKFLDRTAEWTRLDRLADGPDGGLAVIWGRRRIGKTRLLVEWCRSRRGVYAVADQSAGAVQRRYLASAFSGAFEGFGDVEYPDWRSLLVALSRAAKGSGHRGPFVLDELPYLVAADPAFPSVLQSWLDHEAKEARLTIVVAGSAQHMMQGLALNADSPLFGRASQAMKLSPLPAGHIGEALGLDDPRDQLRAWAIFGGVPRYWELAASSGRELDAVVDELMLDPIGPLHSEPDRLLAMETPSAMALRPILDVIGAGAHRISEIGGRLGQPATSLSRPLNRLMELGYVGRQQPFGAAGRESRRALYVIDDPFTRAWFRVVAPHRAFFASAGARARRRRWIDAAPRLYVEAFEELCRAGVPGLGPTLDATARHGSFGPAGRYWQAGAPEWDVVALSENKRELLLGEVKWTPKPADEAFVEHAVADLLRKGTPPNKEWAGLEIHHVVFVPVLTPRARKRTYRAHVIEAAAVLRALR